MAARPLALLLLSWVVWSGCVAEPDSDDKSGETDTSADTAGETGDTRDTRDTAGDSGDTARDSGDCGVVGDSGDSGPDPSCLPPSSATPADGATGVSVDLDTLTLTFPAGVDASQQTLTLDHPHAVRASAGGPTLTVDLLEPFAYDEVVTYTVTDPCEDETTVSFTMERRPAACRAPVGTVPTADVTGLPLSTVFRLQYAPGDAAARDAAAASVYLEAEAQVVDVDVTIDGDDVLLTPVEPLSFLVVYSAYLEDPCGELRSFSWTAALGPDGLACEAPVGFFPASGDTAIAASQVFTVDWAPGQADAAASARVVLSSSAGTVPVDVSQDGDRLTVQPWAPLATNTAYTLDVISACGDVFTADYLTAAEPDAVGGANLVDKAWYVDLSNAVVTKPTVPGVDLTATVLSSFNPRIALGVVAWDGVSTSLTARLGGYENDPLDPTLQDVCVPTNDVPGVGFSTDPGLEFTLPGGGSGVDKVAVSARFGLDGLGGPYVETLTIDADVPAATVAAQVGVTANLLCFFIGGCSTCPVAGTGQCVHLVIEGGQALPMGAPMDAVLEADVLADAATCPGGVESVL